MCIRDRERSVTTRPSTVGENPARGTGFGAEPGPVVAGADGLIFATAALPAAFSLAQSIFCSEARSLGCNPSSFMICLASSLDRSAPGKLPPPPDCTDARWKRQAADDMPIRHVTFEPPP